MHNAVKELLDLRLLEYSQRETVQQNIAALSNTASKSKIENKVNNLVQLAFYPNLKIACGHFKTGDDSQVHYMDAPQGYGHLLADKHFLAKATGNSMNGGKHPILDGDLLLLELITPESAGSLQGQTVVIENHDLSGDEQYLLRDVRKLADGRYQLLAKNSSYEAILADEQMKPLARLKGVVK